MSGALEIIFLVRVLHVRPAYTGAVVALAALGGVAGGAASGPLSRRIGSARIIWVSILGLGPATLLIPLAQPGPAVVLCVIGWAVYAFSGVLYNVAQLSYRQAICPPELLGRMNAAVRWIVWGTLPVGSLLGGVLGSALGVRAALWVAVAGSWAAGLWMFFSPLRGMRDVPVPVPPSPLPPGIVVGGDSPAVADEGRAVDALPGLTPP
jgi:MFS family permease